MSTAKINAIDARINENGYLEVGESLSKNVELGDEYITIPLEGKWKTRTAEKDIEKEDKLKRNRTAKTELAKNTTAKKRTTSTTKKAATKKTTSKPKTAETSEQAPKRKPGRPRKVISEGEER